MATPNTITRADLGGVIPSAIPATAFAGTDTAPFTLSSLTLTTFPTNATSIIINGQPYTSATFATASAAARTLLTDANGNLAAGQSVSIDPSTGTASVLPFTVTDNQGVTSTAANLTINYVTPTVVVTGIVFEDVNYGGGAGRPYATANTSATGFTAGSIRRSGAVVELYDGNGNYVTTTTTDATGNYTFTVQPSSGYTVRVVNTSVSSVRTGYTSALVPVQTYNGTTTKVGGEYPSRIDAAANTTNATLASLTPTAAGSTTAAESIAAFTTGTGLTFTGPDFGFNFDLVVNTNDAGQGSLRQFILNSNALGDEAKLAQSGSSQAATAGTATTTALAAGVETSIFKIPNGTAVAGQLAGLVNQFTATTTGTAATISLTSAALPAITGSKTVIDGGTQTFSTSNSNAYSLATLNAETTGPEVIIDLGYRASPAVAGLNSLQVNANDVQLLNLGIANSATNSEGITIKGNALRTLITNNTINNNDANITYDGSGTANASVITYNVIRNTRNASNDGIELNGGNNNLTISYNQILRNAGNGIDFVNGSNTGNTITYNNFVGNGTSTQSQSSGVALRSANANNNTISFNQFTSNYGAGIVVIGGSTGNVFSQNSFSGNGVGTNTRGTGSLASPGLAIDLTSGTNANDNANGDGVTLNDNGDADTGANGLLNFPVITSATTQGSNLVITGFARAGSKIELYGVGATADPTGFGEGATYLTTVTEGVGDNDASTNQSYSGIINRLNQGSDNSANGFSFTIPLSSLPGVTSGTLLSSTATLGGNTSEFSGNVAVDPPFAQNVTNVTVAAGPLVLNPNLSGTANGTASGGAANTIASYTIVTLPTLGTLTYVKAGVTTTVTANTNITAAQLASLRYTPVAGSTATQSFTYNVTDANGAISAMNRTGTGATSFGDATYTIPVQDLTISGTVYNDVNGLTNGAIDGTATGAFGSAQLYINLINNTSPFAVVASALVAANGTYSFGTAQGVTANTGYRLYLSTTAGTVGSSTTGSGALALAPAGYGFTGEGTTATGDGTANGFFALPSIGTTPVSGLNFGLDFLPTSGANTMQAATNPGGTNSVAVLGTNFSGTDVDPNVPTPAGFISAVTLTTAFPTNATSVTINGKNFTSFTGTTVADRTLTTNADGSLATGQTLSIDPVDGAVNSVIRYAVTDNAGLASTGTASTVTLNFAADVTTTISGPANVKGNVETGTFTARFTNNGPSTANDVTRIITLPPGATLSAAQLAALPTGAVYTAPASTTASGTINFGNLATLAQGAANAAVNTFSFVPYNGGSSPVSTRSDVTTTTTQGADAAANFDVVSSAIQFTPVPAYVTTSPTIPSNAGQTAIQPLTATDQDGTILRYTIQTIPLGTQGVLYFNTDPDGISGNYARINGTKNLTPGQAGTLKFDPTGSYAGNVTFTYTATDNDNNVSTTYKAGATFGQGAAVYTIPVISNGISADNDSNVVPKNTVTIGNVLLNDTNPANTGLAVATAGSASFTENGTTTTTVFTNGSATTAHGTVKIAVDGSYTYTPNPDYTGPDKFAYQVCTATATTKTCATALVSLLVYDPGTACTSSTGPNLLVNPDFNSGNTGFATDYTYVASGGSLVPENTYAVTANVNPYHPNAFYGTGHTNATNASDQFMAINGSATVQRIYSQTVMVQPNRYYTFSAFFNNLIQPGKNIGLPELGFVINGESTSGTLVIGESPDRWVRYSDIWYSGDNTTATFEIRNRSTVQNGNDFAIDDVYFGTCNLAPLAANDLNTTAPNTPVTFIVSGSGTGSNDSDGDGYIDPASVNLDPSTAGVQTSYTDASGNKFMLSTSGTGAAAIVSVTFTPATGFTGVASIPYVVKDNDGALSNPGTISVTVRPPATDVATTISAGPTAVNAGAMETITVRSLNNGPATAQNVQQSLYLPAGLGAVTFATPTVGTGATLTSGSPSYDNATGLVTFPAITSQASGTTGTIIWMASFAAPVNGPFTATAAVASGTNQDTNTNNNTASTSVTVNPRFDLSTTISGPTSVTQNGLLTYTVTTSNATGSSIAQNALQTVTGLPTGLTQVFVSNGGTYNSTTGTITFLPLALAAGQTTSNTISFVATGAANSTITPTAVVTPNTDATGDIATANNRAFLNATATASSTTVTAPASPDQVNVYTAISTNATGPVAGGTAVTVNVTVGNYGPKTAADVVETVTLQPGLTVTGLPAGASYNLTTGVVTFNSISLASAASQTYSFSVTAPTTGPVMLAAAARTTSLDVVPADNVASTKVDVLPTADVATSLAGPTVATAGQPVTYSVTTLNKGVGAAAGVAQTVTLPVGLTAAGLQLNGSTGMLSNGIITFADNSTYNTTTGVLTLPVLTSAPAGTTRVSSITFPAPVASGTLLVNADVSSFTPDGVTNNNAARTNTTVQPSLDVVVSLSGPTTALIFGPVSYSVTTTNNGPSVASSVSRTLQLPTSLQGAVLPDGASYSPTTGLVTFAALSNLASGASVTQTVSFTMPDVAQLTGLAAVSVGGTISDRNLDNNRASLTTRATTPTDPIADLSATVAAPAGVTSVAAGQPITLTATFANGPISTSDRARNVRPVLVLPAGLSGTVAVSNGGAYDPATGLVTWPTVAKLIASDSTGYAPLVYTVTLNAPGTGPLTATASVASDVRDETLANNSQTLSVPVTASVDVATYVTGPASATAGNSVTYAVTTINNGPSTAAGVTQKITLPAGVTSYSLNGGAPIAGSGTVTILNLAAQQPGAAGAITQTITFTAPGAASSFDVKGDVAATGDNAAAGNNTSTTTTALTNRAPVALNVVNTAQAPEGNTATAPMPISSLVAKDVDGDASITKYTVVALPPASQGKLYVWNGTANTELTDTNFPGLALTTAQAQNLRFAPAVGYIGNVFFQYTATDNGNGVASNVLTSAPALYTLTVGKDNNSLYAATDVKGSASKYATKDVLAYVIDPNGSAYTSGGLVYKTTGTTDPLAPSYIKVGTSGIASTVQPTGATSGPAASGNYPANPTNVLPAGVSLDPATGLIYVSDASQLVNYPTVKYYQINVITTDIYGGVNTTVAQFTIGAYPLPVTLTAFEAQAVQNRDALLSWTTASEANNNHFEVERSLNGSTFVKIGQLAGHGTSTTSNTYSLTDAGIGAKATGTVYYRLRQVDLDGTGTYSPVRTVSFVKPAVVSLSLYPNPTADQTGLDLSQLPATATVQVQLLDATGRTMLNWTLAGGEVRKLDVHTMASGSYVLLVSGTQPDGSALRQALRLTKE